MRIVYLEDIPIEVGSGIDHVDDEIVPEYCIISPVNNSCRKKHTNQSESLSYCVIHALT